jgi:hypothetical protein
LIKSPVFLDQCGLPCAIKFHVAIPPNKIPIISKQAPILKEQTNTPKHPFDHDVSLAILTGSDAQAIKDPITASSMRFANGFEVVARDGVEPPTPAFQGYNTQ